MYSSLSGKETSSVESTLANSIQIVSCLVQNNLKLTSSGSPDTPKKVLCYWVFRFQSNCVKSNFPGSSLTTGPIGSDVIDDF